ncbi:fungal specific transcription factor [Phlyctema vagabunda]|uniref:Fungal specific transcription factor n=1 Tax=Phlyctema vagabunda TaxID=108571 RepID=A0ABR4P1G7_9HELO
MDDPALNENMKPAPDDTGISKRSRGLGFVTPNACTECRKKRAKCDGHHPCGRCRTQKSADCVYEIPVRQSKENMRIEIEQLRKHQQQSESVFAALSNHAWSDMILEMFRNGESLDAIFEQTERLRQSKSPEGERVTSYEQSHTHRLIMNAIHSPQKSETPSENLSPNEAYTTKPHISRTNTASMENAHQWVASKSSPVNFANTSQSEDSMNWTPDNATNDGRANLGSVHSDAPIIGVLHEKTVGKGESSNSIISARSQGQEVILGPDFAMGNQTYTNPDRMAAWTSITADTEFVKHLMTLYFCWEYPTFASLSKEHFLDDFKSGRQQNCSALLVNAILALGCRFSLQAKARAVPDDPNTAGDHFFAEAKDLLNQEQDRHSTTTIQALGLMSIREASCGRSSHSIYLSDQAIRLTVEMGLHLEKDDETEDATEERAVRAATFWGAFSLDQAWSVSIGRLPCFSKDTNLIRKPEILDHVERSVWMPYTDDGVPLERNCKQPSNVRSVYRTFCDLSEIVHKQLYAFYTPGENLTSTMLMDVYTQYLKWYEGIPSALRLGQNFTPAVLFAHMYYHYAILLLFRPFIKLKLVDSELSPREVCRQAADAISTLVKSYSKLYTLRRTPSFTPYFILTASLTHLVAVGKEEASIEKLEQTIADLEEIKPCHRFAARSLDILRFFIYEWKIDIPLDLDEETLKKMCRVLPTSTNQFCPNISQHDMMKGIGQPTSPDENPLFWPFPMQGRPMMGVGDALGPAGFEVSME